MQVERESGGDLARAFFDEDPEDERVVTISFFLISCFGVVELPFARISRVRVERMVKISKRSRGGILKSQHK